MKEIMDVEGDPWDHTKGLSQKMSLCPIEVRQVLVICNIF